MVDDVVTISSCGVDSIKVNAIVQAKVETKQLELGHIKCFNMHIGKKDKHLCPTLKVHGADMLTSDREKYLGDILTTDGKIDQNIIARCSKGIGKVNEIMGMLQEISFGPHYFKMALLFRNSILISSMLGSSEVLYGLTNSHIEKLEQVDRIFFRRLFQVPNCTTIEAFYLETSAVPVRFILMSRRLLYLWDILQKNESELVRKVFDAQKMFTVKNDWVLQVQSDLEECGIFLTENEIAKMKRITYTKLVTDKIHLLSAKYLCSLKERHSKSVYLQYSKEMQPYLRNESLSIESKKLMFRIKNRLIDVKTNFKGKYKDNLKCCLCDNPEESQPHLVECSEIVSDDEVKDALEGFSYNDIFTKNLQVQTHLLNTWKRIMKIRNIKLKQLSSK
jgi:hypothetical protein